MNPHHLDLSSLARALQALAAALEAAATAPPGIISGLMRDATLHRFAYTFELACKFMRRTMLALGQADMGISPRPILRRAGQDGLIDDVEAWFDFLEARNEAARSSDEGWADAPYAAIGAFAASGRDLLVRLRRALDAAAP